MKFKATIITTLLALVLFFNCKKNDIAHYATHHTYDITDDRDALRPPEGYGTGRRPTNNATTQVQHTDPSTLKQESTLSCPAVTGLTQTNFSTNTVTLSWNDVGSSKYGVYKETFSGSNVWDLMGTTTTTSFIMTGLAALGSYQVGVGSYNHNSPCPISNTILASTGKDSIDVGQPNVVFLQFNPDTVTGTSWNLGNTPIISYGSNLDDTSRAWILNWVRNYYQGHGRIEFTLNKSVYLASDPSYRQEIIFTTNDTFYCGTSAPCAGGVSVVGSFHTNTPNWVFTRALNYNNRNIGQAGGHELGHALNIRYHAIDACGQTYAPSQTLCADGIYRSKIMGTGYSDYQHLFQRSIYTSLPLAIPILSTFNCPTNHPDEDATIEAFLR